MSNTTKQNKKRTLFRSVQSMTVAAMLAAMSVVIGIFCKNLLNFGGGLFRITFENFPIILSGIMFGPVIGCLVGIASDLISYLLSAQVYPPNLIVTAGAAAVGLISGIMSRYVVRKKGMLTIIISGGLAHIVGSMIIKPIGLFAFYGWAVLWRIPLYLLIAPTEILIMCLLNRRASFRRLLEQVIG